MAATNLIDLDAIDNFPDITIKLKGKKHKLVPVSVDDFVANTKLLTKIGAAGDIESEVEGLKEIIVRAFPTLDKADLGAIPLVNLNKLVGLAQDNDGTGKVNAEVAEQQASEGKSEAA